MNSAEEVRDRLTKLELMRNFYTNGSFFIAKVFYTTDSTCVHVHFDYIEKNVYQCRECNGMIFLNQINKQ